MESKQIIDHDGNQDNVDRWSLSSSSSGIPGRLRFLARFSKCSGRWPKRWVPWLGVTEPLVGVLLDVAAIAVVLLLCLLAGLEARRTNAQKLRNKLDQILLGSFPGYAFVKSLAENMQHGEELATSFVPVLVRFDDFWQVAFETDRSSGGIVALYLPGAPNPWSGTVWFSWWLNT